jgi:hypothetical protein
MKRSLDISLGLSQKTNFPQSGKGMKTPVALVSGEILIEEDL